MKDKHDLLAEQAKPLEQFIDPQDITHDFVEAKPYMEYKTKPHHYKSDNDVISFCLDNNIGFCEGNIIKYIRRWKEKNGVEDLLKAREYIDRLIQKENGSN